MNWRETYDDLWGIRHKLIKDFISSGETHPLRLYNMYRYVERFYSNGGPIDHANNSGGFPLLPTGVPAFRRMAIENRIEILPFYNNSIDFLVDLMMNDKPEAVIELGSGYGRNLIDLFYRCGPKEVPYYAGEYTKTGTEFAQTMASLSTDFNLIPFRFDHNNPDLTSVKENSFIVIFTYHSIEQVAELRPDYFRILASQADRVVGVHFEPFGFQMPGATTEIDESQRQFFAKNNWNMNLYEVLSASSYADDINLKCISKNILMSDDASNPTSLIVWETKA